MRLSEAIRLGAMLKPQAFLSLRGRSGLESCAMNCAIEALSITGDDITMATRALSERYAFASDTSVTCPGCDFEDIWSVIRLIPHLNDMHRWTREAIADWVETIELAHESAQAGAAVRMPVDVPVVSIRAGV